MGKVIGIDLGTTNSVVAVMEGKEVKVIANQHGSTLTPSVVAISDKGERLVGITAKRQAITNPRHTIFSIKRFMGRRRSEVRQEEAMMPYEVVGAPDEPARVRLRDRTYTPQEISAMVLQDLKATAERYLGEKVTDAVITCPAYFNDSQRQATKEAGQIAGLNVRRVFNEPTAAALAYGLDKKKSARIAVYDLGGGTFDISILEVDKEVIQVLSTNGNTHLGGDDFDQRLIRHVAEEFRRQHGIDLLKDPMAHQRLKEACERAKCELSSMPETEINLPYITADASGPKHLQMRITRAKFEELIRDLVEGSLKPCEQALADAKLSPKDIDEIVMVGGSTRIPMVQRVVRDFFGRNLNLSVNPDEVVAVGAAIQAAVLAGEMRDILLLDVTPLTLGVKVEGGLMVPLIKRNTTIPTRKSEIFSTASDNQPAVTIEVYQGERQMAEDNRLLGRFNLEGVPPAPRGVPQIEVTFDIDANGILNVTARDKGTGREQSIRVEASTGLSKEEIERMVREAEVHGEEDRRRRELAETRNQAEHQAYSAERLLKDFGEKISKAEKEDIESAIRRVRSAREGEDMAEMRRAMEDLQKAMHAVSKRVYEEAGKAAGSSSQEEPPRPSKSKGASGEGKVVDAEFDVKD